MCMCVMYACGWVCAGWVSGCVLYQYDKTKISGWNELRLGVVLVLDTVSKFNDFRFKRSRVRGLGHRFNMEIRNGCIVVI